MWLKIIVMVSRGPPDVCALLRAKCAGDILGIPGLDGSLLVLQDVSVADGFCHCHCLRGPRPCSDAFRFFLDLKSRTNRMMIGSSACKYPSSYLMVLLTWTKAIH